MKTVIEMAREAGLHRQQHNLMSNPVQHRFRYDGYEENLERFAAIVLANNPPQSSMSWQEGYAAGAAAENEACAKVCDEQHDRARTSTGASRADACAKAIRARRKHEDRT